MTESYSNYCKLMLEVFFTINKDFVFQLLMFNKNWKQPNKVVSIRKRGTPRLKEKALHALFSLRKHTNISKLSPVLANKIFDIMTAKSGVYT